MNNFKEIKQKELDRLNEELKEKSHGITDMLLDNIENDYQANIEVYFDELEDRLKDPIGNEKEEDIIKDIRDRLNEEIGGMVRIQTEELLTDIDSILDNMEEYKSLLDRIETLEYEIKHLTY